MVLLTPLRQGGEAMGTGTLTPTNMISTSTRKRGASFLLEKPLVSRLPFEVEQPLPDGGSPALKRPCLTMTLIDEELDQELDAKSETSDMQEMIGVEEIDSVGVEFEERGGWLAEWRVKQGRSRSGGGHEDEGVRQEKAGSGVGLGLPPPQDTQQEQASAVPAAGTAGPGRALVQLKIDAMFAAPKVGYSLPTKASSAALTPARPQRLQVGSLDEKERAGMNIRAERVVGMDSCAGVAGADAGEREGGPACYACRGALGTEGGDELCSFCDRAACQSCWQKCFACELPHCSLCLATDYSSKFESYFCPPCYQDRRLESC